MTNKKLTWQQLVLIASLIFGMFFGAGNLIFPVQLGQLAGGNWLPAPKNIPKINEAIKTNCCQVSFLFVM